MRFLPPDEQIDLYSTGFSEDLLGRTKMSKQLSELLERIEDPLVIALDGGWGTGKSYFLKRWVAAHSQENGGQAMTVYFDAFANDYLDEPLIGLIGALSDRAPKKTKSTIHKLQAAATKLALPTLKIGLAAFSGGASEILGPVANAALNEATKETNAAIDAFWKQKEGRKTAMKQFHTALESMTESDDSNYRTPLIIVIDELDRCRPDYALEVLEVIKHFFTVPYVHFVLGVNLRSLENSVIARYGPQIDATAYLQKFLSLKISLPEHVGDHNRTPSTVRYLIETGKKMALNEDLLHELELQATILLRNNAISIRDAGKILSLASLLPDRAVKQSPYAMTVITVTLLITRVIRPDIFIQLVNASITKDELIKYLNAEDQYIKRTVATGDHNPKYERHFAFLFAAWIYILEDGPLPNEQHVIDVVSSFGTAMRTERKKIPLWINDNWLNVFKLS